MPWSKLSAIRLERSWLGREIIHFTGMEGDSTSIPLCFFASQRRWREFMCSVESYVGRGALSVDERIESIPPSDILDSRYTDIWLSALEAPPERQRLEPLEDGQRVSHYEVIRQVGAGGQGIAYLARDFTGYDAPLVVLKEYVLPIFVDLRVRQAALEKFRCEAATLSSLNHPGIVRLVDFFVEDGRCYLVLEYIEGTTLRQRVLKQGALSEETAISHAAQLCEILSYLHNLEPPLVHGDVTPDNLIMTANDTLRLIDFTIAQHPGSSATPTVVGKQRYMPPEQFAGKATPQSDIYALGCTMHFMLTGQDPEAITQSHPRSVCPDVSHELDALVARCTALDLSARYTSSDEILAALNRWSEYGVTATGNRRYNHER